MEEHQIIQQIISENKLPSGLTVSRFTSGITNNVYALGEKYVLKMEGKYDWSKGILKHQKELVNKLLAVGAKVPKILLAGEIDERSYLLMERLPGTNIVYEWMNFSMKEKENYIMQVTEQLKLFHSLKFDDYAIRIATGDNLHQNLHDAVAGDIHFDHVKKELLTPAQVADVEVAEEFYQKHIADLSETGTAVLVHNDIHLENIFFKGDSITGIIDFDWACQAPKDYELWKLVEVTRMPMYAVEERLEPLYENYQMIQEFGFIKKYYPELFQVENLANRIRLYYLEKYLSVVIDRQGAEWGERARERLKGETEDIYRTDWLDRLVTL